jgi:hypothetical protein
MVNCFPQYLKLRKALKKSSMKPIKALKIFNGRGHGIYEKHRLYVAAYSVAECVRIINESCESHINANEINIYYSKGCWGNPMDGIIATEPCVYVGDIIGDNNPVKKIYPLPS